MSTGARARRRGLALLAVLVLASCAETDERAEWQAFKDGFTDSVLRRDFDAVYPLVRAEMNREALEGNGRLAWIWMSVERPVGPEDWAVYRTGSLLAGGFEYLVNPHKHPEDYNEALREPALVQDRFRAAVVWFRRAADRGVIEAGRMLAGLYRDHDSGLSMDDELATCFENAARSLIVMTVCRRLEQAKGYDPGS